MDGKNKKQFGKEILQDIKDYVEEMASGSIEERKFIRFTKPSNELFLGCLYPKDLSIAEEKNVEESTGEETVEVDEEEHIKSMVLQNTQKPYFLSVSFLTKPEGLVVISLRLSLYYRVIPDFEDYKIAIKNQFGENEDNFNVDHFIENSTSEKIEHPEIWERVDIELPAVNFDLAKPRIENHVIGLSKKPKRTLWKEPSGRIDVNVLKEGNSALNSYWDNFRELSEKNWQIELRLEDRGNVPGITKEYHMFTVSLLNITKSPYDERKKVEAVLFDCHLNIDLKDCSIIKIPQRWEYELPYSSEVTKGKTPKPFEVEYPIYTWGNGCFPEFKPDENKIVTKLTSSYRMKRITPWDIYTYKFKESLMFKNLESSPKDHLNKIRQDLISHKDIYSKFVEKEFNQKAKDDLSQFKIILKKFEKGTQIIEDNNKARNAFKLLNETYKNAYGHEAGWRLFQLVFIVGNISSVISTIKGDIKDLNDVEILFVATGGGKTEAYVGLTVWLLFYQRIIGQEFGTATWVKFPLRLLALDQYYRLINIIIWAERIRTIKNIPGEPFSLGFFVGGSDQYPGTVAEWVITRMHNENEIRDPNFSPREFSRMNGDKEKDGALLIDCPVCRSLNDDPGDYRWQYSPEEHIVKHWCAKCMTSFNIYITDEEVYRFLPSVLVSTVDKLAVGAWRPPMGNLLGATLYRCPKHGFTCTPKECSINSKRCGNSKSEIFKESHGRYDSPFRYYGPFDPQSPFHRWKCDKTTSQLEEYRIEKGDHAPILVVQDELHLLRENLGTTNSYFETLTDTIIFKNSGRYPKHVAMSATLAGTRKQVGLLYLRNSNLWPGDAPTRTPLTIPLKDAFFQYSEREAHRIYVGIMPHGKTPDFSSYRTLQYSWCRIQQLMRDPILLRKVTKAPSTISDKSLKKFINEFYKKSFVYQGRKIGTHNFASSIDRIVNPDIKRYNNSYKLINADSVTGDNSMEEIREFRKKMDKGGELDVLVSTSLISHGVDMENVNLMFFQGIPDSTSEFIQASSRVGRKYPGLLFISFYPSRSRDLELSSSFVMYLSTMRYWVEPVAILRWSKQALQEIFVTAFCFLLSSYGQELLGGPEKKDNHWPITIHQLGSLGPPSRTAGYLSWRYWDQNLDSKIENTLLEGLGLSLNSQKYAPQDLIPPSYLQRDLEHLFNKLLSKLNSTLTSKKGVTLQYITGQIAYFCKQILGSPQKSDHGGHVPNGEFVERWYQCMTGLRGIQTPVEIQTTQATSKYLGEG
mgnify:CR=1 FL=1